MKNKISFNTLAKNRMRFVCGSVAVRACGRGDVGGVGVGVWVRERAWAYARVCLCVGVCFFECFNCVYLCLFGLLVVSCFLFFQKFQKFQKYGSQTSRGPPFLVFSF